MTDNFDNIFDIDGNDIIDHEGNKTKSVGKQLGSTISIDNIEINDEFEKCLDIIDQRKHVFITGDAGTGKSTLLKYFASKTKKRIVILAPTGVAAVNIGGQTIHSFFRFPPKPLTENNIPSVDKKYCGIYKHLDAIVIDEVSMVRADMMDAMNIFLRMHVDANRPFGGKQMIMFGDLNQLPPVVSDDVEKEMMKDRYKSKYFFDAQVFKDCSFEKMSLSKVYRQKDKDFIRILNKIKTKSIATQDIDFLNGLTHNNFIVDDETITLCSTNALADHINTVSLNSVPGAEYKFEGKVIGKFNPKFCNADEIIHVKKNCRIMILINDPEKRWHNGSVGILEDFTDKEIVVNIRGKTYKIPPHEYKFHKYRYNPLDQSISAEAVGTFTQFPIRLAYAITIHKCIEENQLIHTKRGLIPIKSAQIGDHVLTHTGEYKKILNVIHSGYKKCYEILTKSGLSLKATKQHPLAIPNGDFKEIKYLKIGDKILNVFDQSEVVFDHTDYPPNILLSYFIGYCIGDGSYNGSSKKDKYRIEIIFNKKEKNNLNHISKLLDQLLPKYDANYHIDYDLKNRNVHRIRIHCKKFREFLENKGLLYVKKQNKSIPISILESKDLMKKAYCIAGLWDSDGSCDLNQLRLNNISRKMLSETQLMLSEFGIGSTIRPQSTTTNTKHKSYVLRIVNDDINKFKTYIPIICDHKVNNLKSLCDRFAVKKRSQYWIKYIDDQMVSDIILSKLKHYYGLRNDTKFFSNHRIKKIAEKTSNKNYINYYKKIWRDDIIEDIKDIGICPVYDIEVEDDHSFVSQGFGCHNSQGKTFDKVNIDIGRGAFAHGQLYVALSRCTSLEGINLTKKIHISDIIYDRRIIEFMRGFNVEDVKEEPDPLDPKQHKDLPFD